MTFSRSSFDRNPPIEVTWHLTVFNQQVLPRIISIGVWTAYVKSSNRIILGGSFSFIVSVIARLTRPWPSFDDISFIRQFRALKFPSSIR
jgi:hypothetical protein